MNSVALSYARKLGWVDRTDLLEESQRILGELSRSAQVRQLGISSTCLTLLSLQLAVELKDPADSNNIKEFQKLSGVKMSLYQNFLKNVRDLLGVKKASLGLVCLSSLVV